MKDLLTSEPAVLAHLVSKTFGTVQALSQLSFTVNKGECFGLLGPNGAGKSTMIKLIYGVLQRSSGNLQVLGFDPSAQARLLRKNLGVVLQEDALDEAMDVEENMLMFCRFHSIPAAQAKERVNELLHFMALETKIHSPIATLSGGMKRRLAFVRSLLPQPKLLILDEPSTGLDPAVRQLLWDKIRALKQAGTTVILTTHYMDEAENLCDRLVLIDRGAIQAEGHPKELMVRHNAASLEDVFLKLTGRNLNG